MDSKLKESNRLYFVDNLRIMLIILVVIAHIAITYGAKGGWYYFEHTQDTITNVFLQFFLSICQAFTLGLFFLISAYFIPKSLNRKGAKFFIKDKLFRLGLPLFIYELFINPVLVYLNIIRVQGIKISYLDYFKENMLPPKIIGTGPLWFVEALLLFSFIYVLFWKIIKPRSHDVIKSNIPKNISILVFILILSTITFLIRIKLPIGWSLKFFHLQFPFYPQYVSFFILGIVSYKLDWLTSIPEKIGKQWMIVGFASILCFPILALLGGAVKGEALKFTGGFYWQNFAYCCWESFVCMGMTIGLLSLFKRKYNKQNRITKVLSKNAYGVYLIHAPIIVLIAYACQSILIYPLLKFLIVSLIAVPLCFIISHYGVIRIPYADKIL
ncbi:MAG: acyltransferase [Clostridiaceae bacterium]|nr:acyltransferase [Clostridiaceae bacterium]